MSKSLLLSAYGIRRAAALLRRVVSLIVPHNHSPWPSLGLLGGGHRKLTPSLTVADTFLDGS